MFKESIKNSVTLFFDSWTTDRKNVNTGFDYELDVGSATNNKSAKYLTAAHQTKARFGPVNKAKKIFIFNNVNVIKYLCEIDQNPHPGNDVDVEYSKKFILIFKKMLIYFIKSMPVNPN